MRLWTIHPKYLDSKGLVALWREGLLAKAVLEGKTQGYKNHPQLIRFKAQAHPVKYINQYLQKVLSESLARNYSFNASKLSPKSAPLPLIQETFGQLEYEWGHFMKKIQERDLPRYHKYQSLNLYEPHPLFEINPGKVNSWEKISASPPQKT